MEILKKWIAPVVFFLAAFFEIVVNGKTVWDWLQMGKETILQIGLGIIFVGSGLIYLGVYISGRITKFKQIKEREVDKTISEHQTGLQTFLNNASLKLEDMQSTFSKLVNTVYTIKTFQNISASLVKNLLTILDISTDYTTKPEIKFKSKIRITFQNDTPQDLKIQSATIVDAGILLQPQHPTELSWQTQDDRSKKWSEESNQIYIKKGQRFRTWIGQDKPLSENGLLQAKVNKQFGTLVFKIEGYEEEWKIRI